MIGTTMLQMTRAMPPIDAAPRYAARTALLAPLLAGVLLAALPPAALGAPPAGPEATTPAATAPYPNSPLATTAPTAETSPATRGPVQQIQNIKSGGDHRRKDSLLP